MWLEAKGRGQQGRCRVYGARGKGQDSRGDVGYMGLEAKDRGQQGRCRVYGARCKGQRAAGEMQGIWG